MKGILVLFVLVSLVGLNFGQEENITFDKKDDGSYTYAYETADGIKAEESGQPMDGPRADGEEGPYVVQRGSYSYTSPEGRLVTVTHYADSTGFHPTVKIV